MAMMNNNFRSASREIAKWEPPDWTQNPFLKRWKLNGEVVNFDWD